VVEPFIEVAIIQNVDKLLEFFKENNYTEEEVYAIVTSEENFNGFYAEFRLFEDDELLATTSTWDTKKELLTVLKQTLGENFTITNPS
jgi:hypothetical protein